jgi:very-short-patch-repair endonuclease
VPSIQFLVAGWSSLVARRAHNPKVVGSNPAPATIFEPGENGQVPKINKKNENEKFERIASRFVGAVVFPKNEERPQMENQSWPAQFLKSLKQYHSDDEVYCSGFDVPVESVYPEEFNDVESDHFQLLMTILKATWEKKISGYVHSANVALAMTESPIEKAMLSALMVAGYESAEAVRVRYVDKQGFEHDDGDEESFSNLVIEIQKPIGKYKADFVLTYREHGPDFERATNAKDGSEIPGSAWYTNELILECDGHDFHDRTKEQASHDRKRDRALQDLGFQVFRYTGSDIWKNVFACAREALKSVSHKDKLKKIPILQQQRSELKKR